MFKRGKVDLTKEIRFESALTGPVINTRLGAWHTLENLISFLGNRKNWNPNNWYSYTNGHCVSNAIRYVAVGRKGMGRRDYSDADDVAVKVEKLVLAAANHLSKKGELSTPCGSYASIPQFNDETGRTHADIMKVLRFARDQVRPSDVSVTYADDILTSQEKAKMAEEVRKAERAKYLEFISESSARGWGSSYIVEEFMEDLGLRTTDPSVDQAVA